jgi:DNA processing protein
MGWNDTPGKQKKVQKELFIELSAEEQVIVNMLSETENIAIDEINIRSGLSSSAVASAILNLELKNVIQSLPGKRYRLV